MKTTTKILFMILGIFLAAFFLLPMLQHSFAASDVDIDTAIKTTATSHNGTSPSVVFTDDETGYAFYVDSNGSCVYAKTTDGGSSWGSAVTVDAQTDCIHIAVWYDQWTPGNTTGTMIHIVTDDSGSGDTWYTRLDTSNDTRTTTLDTSGANQGGGFAATANDPSITEATDGTIYMGVLDNSDSFVLECSSSCDSNISQWTEAAPSPFTNATNNLILMPLPGGKIVAIIRAVSANTMESKVWSGTAWDASWKVIDASAPGNTTYDGAEIGATLDPVTGNLYLAYGANVATPGTDDAIRTATYSATSTAWIARTNAVTSSSNDGVSVNNRGITGVKIVRDENGGDLYVVYTAQSTPGTATTGNVYYKKSTDQMGTWGSESGPLNTTADDIYGARPNILSFSRIYVTWDEIAVDDLFGSTVADVTPGITVGSSGAQIASTTVPSSGLFIGGAFTFARDAGTGTVSQIVITEAGTVNAHNNLSNLILYYDQQATCATSSIPGGATQFNSTGVSFDGSEQATVTGTMPVGIAQVCVYAKLDVGSGAGAGQTIEFEIADPETDVVADFGTVGPGAAVALSGPTTLPSTVFTQQDFRIYANVDAVQPSSSLAAEDASATRIVSGQVVRVRMSIAISGASVPTSTQAFKLQYAPMGGAGSCSGIPSVSFADVGAFGSGAPWRGFNNTSTADGTTITAALLASSTAAGSYTEENPTAANPEKLFIGDVAEWDFAVQDNAASSGIAYCFRAAESSGATLDAYAHYPELDTVSAATSIASEDAATSTKKNFSIRLRVEASDNGNTSSSPSLRLEYATSTAGPWTAVPVDPTCTLTTAAFRECPSNYFSDLDPTHPELTPSAATFLGGFMLQVSNPAPAIPLDINQYTEVEWNLQATDAAAEGQAYYFRMTDNGTSIGTYSVYPQLSIVAASSTFTQDYYRWYANANALIPSDPWPSGATDLGENAAITASDAPPKNGDIMRVRMSVLVGNETFPTSSLAFKLQYGIRSTSCSAISSWADVGAIGSGSAWRGYDNAGVTDGAALSGDPPTGGNLLLSVSNRAGRYAEQNPSAQNPFKAAIGDEVEYDWALQDNNATSSAAYCFRMVQNNGTALDDYSYYPTVATAGFAPESGHWRFYDDEADETPSTPLAGQDSSPSNIEEQNIIKLRMAIKEANGVAGTDTKFALQFSRYDDFSQGVADVTEAGSCTIGSEWCYATSTGGTDNAVVSASVLSGVDTCSGGSGNGCGTHNTSGISSSTFSQAAGATTEYEFTLMADGAARNATYFFRAVDVGGGSAVPLDNASSSYPSLTMEGATLSFTVSGLPQGVSTNGVVTNVSTTAISVPFGTLVIATSVIAAQRLSITTNADSGYELYAFQDAPPTDSHGDTIPGVAATNAAPLPWTSACTASSTACYGYHVGSPVLSGGSTRFAADDSYAALTSAVAEIGYSSAPASSSTVDVVYRMQVGGLQDSGSYENNLVYIVAPSY